MNPTDAFLRAQPLPHELSAALALAADSLGPFARRVHWYDELPSTNDLAMACAEQGSPEGTLIIAGAQTAGRGRHGRTWCSPPGAGLYVSVVLRPHAHALPLLTIAAGAALAEGIQTVTGLSPALKWPNDLYFGPRKVAGILAEASTGAAGSPRGGASTQAVLGFGINLRAAAYPPDVAARATSLQSEMARPVDPGAVLAACLTALRARYDDLQTGRTQATLAAWRAYARPLLGHAVEWNDHEGVRQGIAQDVDASGALLVRTTTGVATIMSGEVRWM